MTTHPSDLIDIGQYLYTATPRTPLNELHLYFIGDPEYDLAVLQAAATLRSIGHIVTVTR